MKHFVIRAVGFAVGAGFVVCLEVGLLLLVNAMAHREYMPRGAGWIIAPIAVGLAASAAAPEKWQRIERGDFASITRFRAASRAIRAAIAFPMFWIICVGAYVWLFEPYGYMGSDDYSHMFKVMLFPPAVFLVALLLYKKVVAPKGTQKPTKPNKSLERMREE